MVARILSLQLPVAPGAPNAANVEAMTALRGQTLGQRALAIFGPRLQPVAPGLRPEVAPGQRPRIEPRNP